MNSNYIKKYEFLHKEKSYFHFKQYYITPIRKKDIQSIRKWRNEQLDVLRQKKPISVKEQSIYYNKIIKKSFQQKKPSIILFSFLFKKKCIGYGGLVHINWKEKQAEVSFLSLRYFPCST